MFENTETLDELKRIYRKLCKFLHPDLGGDKELMQLATEEYERRKISIENFYKKTTKDEEIFNQQKYYRREDVDKELFKILMELTNFMKPNEEDFFLGVCEYAANNGYVTEKQYNALRGILEKVSIREKKSKQKGSE